MPPVGAECTRFKHDPGSKYHQSSLPGNMSIYDCSLFKNLFIKIINKRKCQRNEQTET